MLAESVSRRQILQETEMHWRTLRKTLEHSQPPGYRMERIRPQPKRGRMRGRSSDLGFRSM
jgi:hypothetical protein